MKKRMMLIWITIVLIILLAGCSQEEVPAEQEPVFRNAYWGMTMEEVKDSETVPMRSENLYGSGKTARGYQTYGDVMFEKAVEIIYWFEDDKLDSITCSFTESHENNNDYIDDYKDVKEILVSKYGELRRDDEKWVDDSMKAETVDYGTALNNGDLFYRSDWFLDEANIVLVLIGGEDGETSLTLGYNKP